jgi:transcriptional regulator with PAS, ATPase and Fis domain
LSLLQIKTFLKWPKWVNLRGSSIPFKCYQSSIKTTKGKGRYIIPLSEYFLNEINTKYGYKKSISAAGYEEFKLYNWPGNVRELRNVIERICILSTSDMISDTEIIDILGIDRNRNNMNNTTTISKSISDDYSKFEKERIMKALIDANGNKSKAAAILGIPRTKLYRKLKNLT